jgi:chaperone required for assembly of F1-ATPase
VSVAGRKRFYKAVTVAPESGSYTVLVDDQPARTPAGASLTLPSMRLADAIAEEWRRQPTTMDASTMPLTRLANTAIDRVANARNDIVEELLRYGGGELLCYRAPDEPLADRQRNAWDPLLNWFAETFGAKFVLTEGVVHVQQPPETILAIGQALAPLNSFELTAVQTAAAITTSVVLPLALSAGQLGPEEAFALSRLDEHYQREQWGHDPDSEARAGKAARELDFAKEFLDLSRS